MGLNIVDTSEKIEDIDIEEQHCDRALFDSGLESDYSLNPYRGCMHNCKYCYSPYVLREERPWGSFIEVKRNIPKVLAKELDKKPKGIVRIGSVTDPYQVLEKDYRLTRMCLEQLKKKGYPVIIQTKSGLVSRDIDIFEEMDVDVGLTITSIDEKFREKFEPNAPPIKERFEALEDLVDSDINTWAFIGPLLPYKNDDPESLKKISQRLNDIGIDEVYLDKLNMRKGIWPKLKEILDEDLFQKYEDIYKGDKSYFEDRKEIYKKIGRTVF